MPTALPIGEHAATDPISAYGINKLMVEKYLQLYARLGGPSAVTLRVANPFGPFQSPFRRQGIVSALIEAVLDRRPVEVWGDGKVVRDYLYAGDVAAAMVAAASYEGAERVFNIGSGIGRSVLDVVHSVCDALDVPAATVIHKPGRRADVPVNVLAIERAAGELGWRPQTEWDEGLRRTADWIASCYPKRAS